MAPKAAHQTATQFALSPAVEGLSSLRRLRRELESVEDFINQSAIRQPGTQATLPRTSRLLESVAADNGLQLLQAADRRQLLADLQQIEKTAPRMHMSFAVEATPTVTTKIVAWLRGNIHPYMLLEVGLQPSIAAGAIVRTNNKVFDFSLRERFARAQSLLVESLEQIDTELTKTPASAPAEGATA